MQHDQGFSFTKPVHFILNVSYFISVKGNNTEWLSVLALVLYQWQYQRPVLKTRLKHLVFWTTILHNIMLPIVSQNDENTKKCKYAQWRS